MSSRFHRVKGGVTVTERKAQIVEGCEERNGCHELEDHSILDRESPGKVVWHEGRLKVVVLHFGSHRGAVGVDNTELEQLLLYEPYREFISVFVVE